jgi:hypothetical protein
MAHRTGQNRQQFGLFVTPLDEMIAPDNLVRVIDAFVDAIDLAQLGFPPRQVSLPLPKSPAQRHSSVSDLLPAYSTKIRCSGISLVVYSRIISETKSTSLFFK